MFLLFFYRRCFYNFSIFRPPNFFALKFSPRIIQLAIKRKRQKKIKNSVCDLFYTQKIKNYEFLRFSAEKQ